MFLNKTKVMKTFNFKHFRNKAQSVIHEAKKEFFTNTLNENKMIRSRCGST